MSIKSQKSKLFLILSLHRSGSSATAGVLHHLGVNMGNNLMDANYSNPKGHYENVDFVNINNKILSSVDASWDTPVSREIILSSKFPRNELRAFFKNQVKCIWGLKDPRTTLTLDIWKPYLEEIAHITYIFVWRSFEASVSSLAHRDNMTAASSRAILVPYYDNLKHYRQQLEATNESLIDLHFDDLISKPEVFVKKINVEIGQSPEQNLDIIKNFLDKDLKHF
ncbi:sulfotransferase family protein [Bacillus pseudomycoides]|nr:sulfotransferase family protein [Bacillus pseudomycoides]